MKKDTLKPGRMYKRPQQSRQQAAHIKHFLTIKQLKRVFILALLWKSTIQYGGEGTITRA